jgi:voltage-gated potassium channel
MLGAMRDKLREIVFGTETRAGRLFDLGLIATIAVGVVVVMLESVASIRAEHGPLLRVIEWGVTVLFTIEYGLRLWIAKRPLAYARSFYGLVDLLSILPTYLALLVPGSHELVVIRAIRILRIFRILKLAQFLREAQQLVRAMRASRPKIIVFLGGVLCAVVIAGAIMHLVEGPEAGFTSIPMSMYWAIVTLTTVGYGDISPQTPLGQSIAALLMVLGYGVIAVPTGIVSAELVHAGRSGPSSTACTGCGLAVHQADARFCRGCGAALGGPGDA